MSVLARFRDPVSGLTHLAGALFAALGLVYLLVVGRDAEPRTVAAVAVYGVSMILLYLSSATYHLLRVSPERQLLLRRLDHSIIPVFIAGSYTPFCVVALKSDLGMLMLVVVWALAAFGLFKSLFWIDAPRAVTAGIYVVMGWLVLFVILPLARAVSAPVFGLIFAGGALYSVGALVYAKKRPDPWPPVFGFHEIWHLFVLGGSACHYAAVLSLV